MNLRSRLDAKFFPFAGGLRAQILFVLNYGVLAPSTHNTQPWLFKIDGNAVEVRFNKKLVLPQADLVGRDACISLGACFENIILAAKFFKVLDRTEDVFNFEDGLAGKIFFKENKEAGNFDSSLEKLVSSIRERFNARGPFEEKSISADELAQLSASREADGVDVKFLTDKKDIAKMAELTASGLREAHGMRPFRLEMSRWINNNFSAKPDGIPGFSMRMPNLVSLFLPTIMKFADLSGFLAPLNFKSILSASAVAVVVSKNNNHLEWFGAGRLAQRVMLKAWSLGYKCSIYIASVEIGDRYKTVQALCKTDWRPVFVFCIGKMNYVQKEVPRHSAESKLVV